MATPSDDNSASTWIYHEFFQANGPLTRENVMDYFMQSLFVDPKSNNASLRMQFMHTGMPIDNEEEQLKKFTGVEYAVVHAIPPDCFVIHKRERLSPDEVRPLAAYFIMNNWIYCAPDIYSTLAGRLKNTLHELGSSLNVLRQHRPDFTPRTGYSWDITQKPQANTDDSSTARNGSVTADTPMDGVEAPTPTPSLRKTKASTSLEGLVPGKNQSIALKYALQTTNAYIMERIQDSIIPPVQPPEDVPAAIDASAPPLSAGVTPMGSGGGAQTATVAGSGSGYTPSGLGAAIGTGGSRSVSTPMVVPGTPANAASPAPGAPGLPGQGKKKKKRQATNALKAALGGSGGTPGPSASAGSPTSPTDK